MQDPLREVLEAAVGTPDDAGPDELDPQVVAGLHLARRRFGVALPPPYAPRPSESARLPIRPGGAADGAAVAAVQRRAWRVRLRGLVSAGFLDGMDLDHLGRYWIGRSALSPSPRHRLQVAGRPGEVHGAIDTGPSRDEDATHDDGSTETGEVRSLYVDPTVSGGGLGSALLAAGEAALHAAGFATATLWVLEGNAAARGFYERWGWTRDGATKAAGVEDLPEVRYRLTMSLSGG